ncbi:phage tail protein [Pseudomonas gorinensis]|uniref:phage tail protein n=1 Tax=Pseudomonas gorinensis TaxID=3240790 RepID=UPI003D6C6C9F
MTDQNSQFFAILTAVGEAKQANAAALGTSWTFAQMAVGDANGTDPIPSRTQTKLINERRRAPLNQVKVDPSNASVIIAEQIIPESVGGWWVREIGLYDAAGDLVAIANCAPTYKPLLAQGSGRTQVIRINLIVSSTSNIELKIDPSVVLATREYVDVKVSEEIGKLDLKQSVVVATLNSIALGGLQTIDGVALEPGARVLVRKQQTASQNGIYIAATGQWFRSPDADTNAKVTSALSVGVERGDTYADTVWTLTTDSPVVIGTTALNFELLSATAKEVAGVFRSVTVDKFGRVLAGTAPTTLAGYLIETASKAEAEADEVTENTKPATMLNVFQFFKKRWVEATESKSGVQANAKDEDMDEGTTDARTVTPLKLARRLTKLLVQATEAAAGLAKLASQSQVDQGLDDATIVTPKKLRAGFRVLLAVNGHIYFPSWMGGLVWQWGNRTFTSGTSVPFATPFPVECLIAWALPNSIVGGNPSSVAANVQSLTPTSMILSWTATGSYSFFWFALGR